MELTLFTHENTAGEEIAKTLRSGKYSDFKGTVAYSRNSGIGRIYNELTEFAEHGGKTSVIAGIDQNNTSYQALINLKTFAKDNLFIHHDKNFNITFHPKVYMFGNEQIEKVIVGSSNLTAGGFYLNYEANVGITLDNSKNSKNFQKQISDYWNNLLNDENTKKCGMPLLKKLLERGSVVDEHKQRPFKEIIGRIETNLPFKTRESVKTLPSIVARSSVSVPALANKFAMTLSDFDVSSRSQDPVILIPLAALKKMPTFWNFPSLYTNSEAGYPQLYALANIHIDGKTTREQHVRIYYYDQKSEFRLQCKAIKRKGDSGDIITIEKDPRNPLGFEIELLRKNSEKFKAIKPTLDHRASKLKHFTYYSDPT